MAICEPRRGHTPHQSCLNLDLAPGVSRTGENERLLFKAPGLWYVGVAAQADQCMWATHTMENDLAIEIVKCGCNIGEPTLGERGQTERPAQEEQIHRERK